MKLVFLGDIHGNRVALEAVLAEIRKRPADAVFHLGNVVGYGAEPAAVIHRLGSEGIEGVRGPHDERVATGFPVLVGSNEDDSVELAESICQWTRQILSAADRRWLAHLPFQRIISTGNMRVAIFNATPVTMTQSPHRNRTDDFFREMGSYTGANVNVFAHTHVPFWRVVDGRWFVNAGSVGFPRDGDRRASFASVELNGGATARVVRVEYPVDEAAAAVRAKGLPSGIVRLLGAA